MTETKSKRIRWVLAAATFCALAHSAWERYLGWMALHEGTTGTRNEGNRYRIVLERVDPGGRSLLRARIKTAGGTDSNGHIHRRAMTSE